MEKLLDQTMERVIRLLLEYGHRPDNWLQDGLRYEINSALMSACLIGRTEALQEVIRRLKEFKAPA